jgi:S-adenosylmethionine synthetase
MRFKIDTTHVAVGGELLELGLQQSEIALNATGTEIEVSLDNFAQGLVIAQRDAILLGNGTIGVNKHRERLSEIVKRNFDFRPGCIQRDLRLLEPQFQKLAAYGHMGRIDLEAHPDPKNMDIGMEKYRPLWEMCTDLKHEMATLESALASAA